MALQNRLRRDLPHLLLTSPSYLNRPQVQPRSQLHVTGISQRFSGLLRLVCGSAESEKKRRRDNDCPLVTKRTSIKQDAGSPMRTRASLNTADKPSAGLLSARACRLPDKLIRDEVPQGPWNRQRAPEFPPKCSPSCIEKPDCCDPCPVPDDPCGGSSRSTTGNRCLFEPYAEKSYFASGLLRENWSRLQSRGLHVSGLKSGVGRGGSNAKSNSKRSKKTAKKLTRKGKEICTKGPREKCFGAKKTPSKKFTSCEPDVSWKEQRCLGHPRGSETCSIDKPQCTETLGPSYRELERTHEDKRMKAWKQSKIVGDKCQPDDGWKENKTCTKNSESCTSGKPRCSDGGSKRSYTTLSRIILNFQSAAEPSRSLSSGQSLGKECDSRNGGEKDKSSSDVFKKEMQEIEECITTAKCKVPMHKYQPDEPNGGGKTPKKGKK